MEGVKIEESEWRRNKRQGRWARWHGNTKIKEESFWDKGIQVSTQKLWYANGLLKSQCMWRDGKKQGRETFWYRDGHKKRVIFYDNGTQMGQQKNWDVTGYPITVVKKSKGNDSKEWNDPARLWERSKRKGDVITDLYTYTEDSLGRSILQGKYVKYYKGSEVKRVTFYERGKKQGTEVFYYREGSKKKKTEWNKGLREGKEIRWWSGFELRLSEINYQQGVKHGFSREWYNNGNLHFELYYEHDTLDYKAKYWYPNGSVQGVYSYKKGVLHGRLEERFVNGALRVSCSYDNGKKSKPCMYYKKKDQIVQFPLIKGQLSFKEKHLAIDDFLTLHEVREKIILKAEGCREVQDDLSMVQEELDNAKEESYYQNLLIEQSKIENQKKNLCREYQEYSRVYAQKMGSKKLFNLAEDFDFVLLLKPKSKNNLKSL